MQKGLYLHVIQAERQGGGFNEFRFFLNDFYITVHYSYCDWLLYFFAKEIFMALVWVILKPCSDSRAAPAWTSVSNSTKAMSWRPGTKRTSLNPGNLQEEENTHTHTHGEIHYELIGVDIQKLMVQRRYLLVEEHGEHELVCLLGQVGEEENVIGRVFRNLRAEAEVAAFN